MICRICNRAFGFAESVDTCISCEKKELQKQVKELKEVIRVLKTKVKKDG